MYDWNDGATRGWSVPCTNEMVHMTRCICHDAGPMMHTPWCKNDDALKQTPELDSCTALQLEWISKPCKIFRSKKRTSEGTRNDNDARWPVLTMLRSPHEENGCRWDSAQGLGEQVRITRKIGWKGSSGTSLLRIYYLIDLHDASCKTCPFMPMQSRNNDKIYSNSECKCSIAMIMMHPRDGWLQWWCNTRMECSMCKWNGAYDSMH